jgi:hydroxyacylglutathione hydrolase
MLNVLTVNPFQENTYLVADDATGDAVVIDAGAYSQAEKEALAAEITRRGLTLRHILLTHAHLDHVFGCAFLKRQYGVDVWMHPLEQVILDDVASRAAVYGFGGYEPFEVTNELVEGQLFTLGETTFEVRFVPGHAPGHVAFVNHAERYVIGGDVLFRGSVGRTDFPYCDHNALINSIETQFFTLPDDYTVWPGHGPKTTIGHEKSTNPYL